MDDEDDDASMGDGSFVTAHSDSSSSFSGGDGEEQDEEEQQGWKRCRISSPEASTISSLTTASSGLQPSKYSVGYKGQYTLVLRTKRSRTTAKGFEKLVDILGGDEDLARNFRDQFRSLQEAKKHQEADGVISVLINCGAPCRVLKTVLGIGSERYRRVRDDILKGPNKRGGKNGLQITDEMHRDILRFLNSLKHELGYPCTHRRIKTYIAEDNISTTRELHDQYIKFEPCEVRKIARNTFYKVKIINSLYYNVKNLT